MLRPLILSTVVILAFSVGCADITVTSDHSDMLAVGSLSTYAWADELLAAEEAEAESGASTESGDAGLATMEPVDDVAAIDSGESPAEEAADLLSASDSSIGTLKPVVAQTQADNLNAAPVAASLDEETHSALRVAIDAAMVQRGFRHVAPADADFLLRVDTATAFRTEHHDPYYSHYEIEGFEDGIVTIDFVNPETDDLLWRGSGKAPLRSIGGDSALRHRDKTKPLPGRRVWPIQSLARGIVAGAPSPR